MYKFMHQRITKMSSHSVITNKIAKNFGGAKINLRQNRHYVKSEINMNEITIGDLKQAIKYIPDERPVYIRLGELICTKCNCKYSGLFPVEEIDNENKLVLYLNILT